MPFAYQQISGHAAARILERVVALYRPRRFPRPEDVLATQDERLRAAGLSRNKIASIKDLAAKCLDGTVPPSRALHRLDEAAIVERLTAVRVLIRLFLKVRQESGCRFPPRMKGNTLINALMLLRRSGKHSR